MSVLKYEFVSRMAEGHSSEEQPKKSSSISLIHSHIYVKADGSEDDPNPPVLAGVLQPVQQQLSPVSETNKLYTYIRNKMARPVVVMIPP